VTLTPAVGRGLKTPRYPQSPPLSLHWYKGNTHTHTLNSDGDSTPDDVVRWYREHGYQFLVLTDHNYQTRVDELNALHGADEKFLVVKGEEVTSTAGGKPVHVNGLDANRRIGAQTGAADSTVTAKSMTIKVKPGVASSKYRIQVIGRDGRVLSELPDASAAYTFTGGEGYVRAKVIESNGRLAWIQPVIVGR